MNLSLSNIFDSIRNPSFISYITVIFFSSVSDAVKVTILFSPLF